MEQVRVTASQILATGKARYPVIGANVNTGAQSERRRGGRRTRPARRPPRPGCRRATWSPASNGKQITDGIGLIVAIRSHQPGETVTLDRAARRARTSRSEVTLDGKVG